jgi:hypothetical protein
MRNIPFLLNDKDSFFSDLKYDGFEITGVFEAPESSKAIEFAVSRHDFLDAAQRCNFLIEYDEDYNGDVCVEHMYDSHTMPAYDFIKEQLSITDGNAQEILREHFRIVGERELQKLRRDLSADFPDKCISADVDTDFCEAALRLANIVRLTNPDWVAYANCNHIH